MIHKNILSQNKHINIDPNVQMKYHELELEVLTCLSVSILILKILFY
jgi:hypothetical protein